MHAELIKMNQYSGCFKLARVHTETNPAHVQQEDVIKLNTYYGMYN
jgi:hypothetical protein